jgi:peptidoglycan/xylan/chitin deacetylase (PgdA/CDA1 family)
MGVVFIMPSLSYTLKAKGFTKTIKRAMSMINRYGFTSEKMERNVIEFVNLLVEYDAKATFPITARTLEKHGDFIKSVYDESIEFAIHGYSHVDYSKLSAKEQSEQIKKAVEIFKKFGIKPYGFRGPYLQANDDTLNALEENGLLYDSSYSIHWNVVPEEYLKSNAHSYELALKLYEPSDAITSFLPYSLNGIVRIPVSLPDDEMLIDRLNIRNQKLLGKIWLKILEETNEKGGVFILQLHPERIPFAFNALKMLIEEATKKNVWIASLKELAEYWIKNGNIPDNYKSAMCITGDIDIMCLWDYV